MSNFARLSILLATLATASHALAEEPAIVCKPEVVDAITGEEALVCRPAEGQGDGLNSLQGDVGSIGVAL